MGVVYLELDDLLVIAAAFLGHAPEVRDYGLLESALARPRASVFGEEAYSGVDEKAAALLLSLVGNHALVDGNKRLGWVATRVFYGMNGLDVRAPREGARDLVFAIAAGRVADVGEVARALRAWRRPV